MTEDEAKTKWCPFARGTALQGFHACKGSGCMAWRWNNDWEGMTEEGASGHVLMRLKRKVGEPKIGYCGLAGKL